MADYKIIIQDTGDEKKYQTGEEFRNGVECDGYFIIAVSREHGEISTVSGAVLKISIEELSKVLRERCSEPAVIIRQASAIAEGYEKATRIRKENKAAGMAREIAQAIAEKFGSSEEQADAEE